MVTGWAQARVRPRSCDLGRRCRRVAAGPGDGPPRRRHATSMVTRRSSPRVRLPPARLVADLADRRSGPAARPTGDEPEARRAHGPDRPGTRCRRVLLVARWDADRAGRRARGPRLVVGAVGRRCRERRRAPDPARGRVGVRAELGAGRVTALPVGCRRLVPGRAGRPEPARADRPDRRRSRTRRGRRVVRVRADRLAGRGPLRPPGDPRRDGRPDRGVDGRHRRGQATARSAAEEAPSRRLDRRDGRGQPVARPMAGDRLDGRRRVGRRRGRDRAPAAGPVAAAGPGRRARGRPAAPADRLAAGGAARRPVRRRRADRVRGSRRPPTRGQPVPTGRGDREARWSSCPDGRLLARRSDRTKLSGLAAVQADPGPGGLCGPGHRLPRVHRVRAYVPVGQRRRVGSRRRPRLHRRGALGGRATLVRWPIDRLRRVVRRLPGAVRAGRGARDLATPESTCSGTRRSPRPIGAPTDPVASISTG